MSDALPLPHDPTLAEYTQLVADLRVASQSPAPGAIRGWAMGWIEELGRRRAGGITPSLRDPLDRGAQHIEQRWQRLEQGGAAPDAELFVAREHGFASWPDFAEHLRALADPASPIATFEAAADAIVSGDLPRLRALLAARPSLVRERSTREHRSTLLHYVSANGVEDFRQRTPPDILAITELLLDAGADVRAESDAYGGRSTTLGLAATSWHPQDAGVQLPLLALLIERGAVIDGPDGGSAVVGCLHNGTGEAAQSLATRGARLDLEGAAGVGRLDLVRSFFDADGRLKPPATPEQLRDGFAWACQFGHAEVVDFLLQRGAELGGKLKHHGQSGLHWAAFGGHAHVVRLLLQRGAPIDARDEQYEGTPLDWALYGWGTGAPHIAERRAHVEVVAQLVRAGAALEAPWYEADRERRAALERARSDPRMGAALRGRSPA